MAHNIKFVNAYTFCEAFKFKSNKKAPCSDGVPILAIKALPQKSILTIVKLINSAFRLRCFPKFWTYAHIKLIWKSGKDLKVSSNHYPISLLLNFGKIFEKILLTELINYIEQVSKLSDEEHGFRSRNSTFHQLLIISELILGKAYLPRQYSLTLQKPSIKSGPTVLC